MTPTQAPRPLSEADAALLAKLSVRQLQQLCDDTVFASQQRLLDNWEMLGRAQRWGQPMFFLVGWCSALAFGLDLGPMALRLGLLLSFPLIIWVGILMRRASRHHRQGTGLEAMPALLQELELRKRAGGDLQ